MLVIHCQAEVEAARQFAEKVGLSKNLEENLNRLEEFGCHWSLLKDDVTWDEAAEISQKGPREEYDALWIKGYDRELVKVNLYKDFSLYSFAIAMQRRNKDGVYEHWMSAGLIYGGPTGELLNGQAPTYTVSLTSQPGWSLHS